MLHSNRRLLGLIRSTGGVRQVPLGTATERSLAAMWWTALVAAAWLLVLSGAVRGGTIYVDSRLGDDRYDGRSPTPNGETSGPVQSLRAAVRRVNTGDSIELAKDGATYYGSLTLFGPRNSGSSLRSFTINGNGATLSGARPVPSGTWQRVSRDVWRVTPVRKAFYQLVLDGVAVTEAKCDRSAKSLPAIPSGHWCAWRGAVYYHATAGVDPNTLSLSLADEEVGITLTDVDDVVIRDLTLQHFRLDGINAHDRSGGVELINVTLQANGRAGLAVGGTSRVVVRDSKVIENRAASVLVTELGEADLQNTQYDVKPTVVE
jgi:hypothetical protein